MTADHGSDSGRQRTVAELLQQYGGENRGGGRRRRRASEPEDTPEPRSDEPPATSAPTADERTDTVTGSGQRSAAPPASSTPPALDSTWASLESPSSRDVGSGTGGFDARNGSGTFSASSVLDGLTGHTGHTGLTGQPGEAPPTGLTGSPWDRPSQATGADSFTPSSPYSGTGIYQAQPYPTGIYQSDPVTSSTPTRRPEEPTDQLPRYPGAGAEATQVAVPIGDDPKKKVEGSQGTKAVEDSGPSTAVASRASLFDDTDPDEDTEDTDDEPVDDKAARKAAKKAAREKARAAKAEAKAEARAEAKADTDGEAPAGLEDGDDVDVEPSGFKAWAVLIAQGVLGAVGGAALWVGFRYLWLNLPVVALAAAVVATAGLVLLVRTIRGSEDLRTTMLAVLVGLIVTISPAVLLLASVR
ncbi:hypothetical protein [Pseudonocardia acaciae]|uniref:hypothetical protein n=1 Tax=Pseudonocardia acaciae TaxID=551276 RepID=UPI00048F84DA|nr:hypothetical protein [Pseudonocardia acaciae]